MPILGLHGYFWPDPSICVCGALKAAVGSGNHWRPQYVIIRNTQNVQTMSILSGKLHVFQSVCDTNSHLLFVISTKFLT